ncbi:glutathione peroxidase [Paenibacillus vulneris]|uniref:Glutathione peroxidase n=1 Tax=Paenibacillus vulneris TaxID=1133364 RepID=A0ABW3UV97_9BACL|nr:MULTISPECIES: glutathione peroxidase [unclassified Paenibacillus]MBE1443652.1 glutathione peroxidase [Paenibacillus sp. OAS669]
MSIYDISAVTLQGKEVSLEQYKGKVLVIVNTASKCGFTPQYTDLQKLYERYNSQGLEILGFPCNQFNEQEPGSNEEVQSFCQVNYGVQFPMFEKTDVRGRDAHPLFRYLTEQAPFEGFDLSNASGRLLHAFLQEKQPELLVGDEVKWNFTKFLVDRDGHIVERFEPAVEPMDMEPAIESLL